MKEQNTEVRNISATAALATFELPKLDMQDLFIIDGFLNATRKTNRDRDMFFKEMYKKQPCYKLANSVKEQLMKFIVADDMKSALSYTNSALDAEQLDIFLNHDEIVLVDYMDIGSYEKSQYTPLFKCIDRKNDLRSFEFFVDTNGQVVAEK